MYLVNCLKLTLRVLIATQSIAEGRQKYVTLIRISNRCTRYTLHKSQERDAIRSVPIM
jgi:hypothetical protein